ncbi:MAG: hypothetical protein Tsb0021_06300 [Chlamydiales bacterium]
MLNNILFFGPKQPDFNLYDTQNITVKGNGNSEAFIQKKEIPNKRDVVITLSHINTMIKNEEKIAFTQLLEHSVDFAQTFGEEIDGEINLVDGCSAGGGAYKLYQLMKDRGLYIIGCSSKMTLYSTYTQCRLNRQIKQSLDPNFNHFEWALKESIHSALTQHFVAFSPEGKIHFKLRSPKTPYLNSVKKFNLDVFWKTSLTENKDHFLKVISGEGKYKKKIINLAKTILLDEINQQSGRTHQEYLNEALVFAASIHMYEKVDGKRTNNLLKIGDLERIKALLEKGAQINAQVHNGMTVLFNSTLNGNTEILTFLLSNGADANIIAKDGSTPLHFACEKGYIGGVSMLLPHVKNINHQTNNGETAAHAAARHGHLEIIFKLKDQGLDLDIEDHEGRTPWFTLLENGHVSDLHDSYQIHLKKSKRTGRTALHFAANNGRLESVKWLVKKGADINVVAHMNKNSPLQSAVMGKSIETVSYLVEAGAQINHQDDDGYASLHLACIMRLEDIVSYLIDKKANINLKSNQGHTPLHIAAATGNMNLVKILMEKGAAYIPRPLANFLELTRTFVPLFPQTEKLSFYVSG